MTAVQQAAATMLEELQSMQLVVCKVKTDHGYVRAVVSQSPPWYSRLCRRFEFPRRKRWRKHRTIIKRVDTLRTLRRIADGVCRADTAYYQRLLPYLLELVEARRDVAPPF